MRIIVIKEASDLQSLTTRLFNEVSKSNGKAEAHNAMFERIKSLNPHVDFKHLEAGTVLLLPDSPELKEGESRSLAGDAFSDFKKHAMEGLDTIAERARAGAEVLAKERTNVIAVLKTPAVERLIESDPSLKSQWVEAREGFVAEQKKEQVALEHLESMKKVMAQELADLAGLLR